LLNGVSHGFLFDLGAAPAMHGGRGGAASTPALAPVAAPEPGSSLQLPLAPTGIALPDQPATIPAAAASMMSSVLLTTDNPVGLPASPDLTSTPPDLLSAADLLGPEGTVRTSPLG